MTAHTSPLRLTPLLAAGSRRAGYVLERNLLVYRHVWIILISGFFEPLFYLFAAEIGIGGLVGDVSSGGRVVGYAEFVAPALLAASAMNGAVYESTMNIFHKLKWAKTYDAMLATPMGPLDIAVGEIGWSLLRGALYAAGFLVVLAIGGLMSSPWGVLALPAAVLVGFAFGAVGMASTTYMRSWQDFDLVNLALLVLFLFSATFYPLDIYPDAVALVAQLSPLYHGVTLIRSLTLGSFEPTLVWHIVFLVVMGAAGLAVTRRRLAALLTP